MSRTNDAYMQVIGFALFLFIILILYKLYIDNIEAPVQQSTLTVPVVPTSQIQPENRVRCPPNSQLQNKNDIEATNKTKLNMYKEGNTVSADGFYNEVVKPQSQTFAPELEEVYKEGAKIQVPSFQDNSCNIKPNKSDLPITNVPLFLLKEDNQPLRLSEKPQIPNKI